MQEGKIVTRPPERDDLDQLLPVLIGFAQQQLQKVGEYLPFGCTMTVDGNVALAAADTGNERPASADVIDLLAAGMRSQATAGTIRASGICYDVRVRGADGKDTDAIALSLEHRDGDRVLVVMPYSKGRFSGWNFGDLVQIAPPDRRVFMSVSANT
jgi:hypothetical protein